jgi:holliday junction DNA helicase RuvA
MYDYFKGKITDLSPTHVTVDCGGVGYHLLVSLNTYSAVKDMAEVKLYAHQVVREDAHLLFGFSEQEERYMFRELLSVTGVGASTARIILSGMTSQQLRNVIASGDVNTLQKVKGIGAKTAQRIVLDLKDKMLKGSGISSGLSTSLHNTGQEQALLALLTLGFARAGAEKALQQAVKSLPANPGVEELIKVSLSYL